MQLIFQNSEFKVYRNTSIKKMNEQEINKYIGEMKETTTRVMMDNKPEKAMFLAVKGMLPHTRLGRKQATHVRVYSGSEHENMAQKPEVWEVK